MLGLIPSVRPLVFGVVAVWMLVTMVVVVRQALDYKSTSRAVGVCVVGWLVQMLVVVLLLSLFGLSPDGQIASAPSAGPAVRENSAD